jgi:hypothetical protein
VRQKAFESLRLQKHVQAACTLEAISREILTTDVLPRALGCQSPHEHSIDPRLSNHPPKRAAPGSSKLTAGIAEAGSNNLMAGWLLGRDELLKVGPECDKKILILTDGHLNRGIVEPDKAEALTRSGFGKDGIRTS